jgi:imidazolonepropionase-like amidohydrolase
VRDAGGPSFALKRAIDEGAIAGPRIYPSGAFITQTAGHGDFRMRNEVPRACGSLSHGEVTGASTIADGVDEVLRAVREQLLLGASQIKVMAGGGVASPYDPIDVTPTLPGRSARRSGPGCAASSTGTWPTIPPRS